MPNITFVEHDGTSHTIDAEVGNTILQTALENMIEGFSAECGGSGNCATCHCYIGAQWLDKIQTPDDNEEQMLEMVTEPQAGSRLSCQLKVMEEHQGLTVYIPESQY